MLYELTLYKTEQTGASGRVWEKWVIVIKGPNSRSQSALGTQRTAWDHS